MGSDATDLTLFKTKLHPPRLPSIVPRGALMSALRSADAVRLVTVVAGAGYGKSTLAAEFLAGCDAPFVWYQLDETDSDLSVFLNYLASGFSAGGDGFGEKTLERLSLASDVDAESHTILSTFLSELEERLDVDTWVVLDDFHRLRDSGPVKDAVARILPGMPPTLHFLITSRSALDIDLRELKAHRQLLELQEDELSFSVEETERLFSEVLALPLESGQAEALFRHTEGWVSGLVLISLALKGKPGKRVGEALFKPDVPAPDLYGYLSDVVFMDQSEEVREFLLKTSVLTRMNPEFCDTLLGSEGSGAALRHLVDSRVFTVAMDDRGEWYRYHHLLHNLLSRMLQREQAPGEIRALNRRAASLWEERGDPEQALSHYIAAGDYETAAGILERLAPELLKARRISFLGQMIGQLPEETMEGHPWLVFDLAKIADMLGQYDEGIRRYGDAAVLFEKAGDPENQARSLAKRGWMLRYTGKPDEAAECLAKVLEVLPAGSPARGRMAAVLSTESAVRGMYDLSRRLEAEALSHTNEVTDEAARANMLYWQGMATFYRGEFKRSHRVFTAALEMAERAGLQTLMPAIYMFLCMATVEDGRFAEALRHTDDALSLSRELGLAPAFLNARTGRALALAYVGDREEALREMEAALDLSRELGAGLEVSETELVAGQVYLLCGDREASLEHYRNGLHLSRRNGYRSGEAWCMQGILLQAPEEFDLQDAVSEIEAILETCGGGEAFVVPSLTVLAVLYANAGMVPEARAALDKGFDAIKRDGGVGWLRFGIGVPGQAEMMMPIAEELYASGEHTDVLDHLFRFAGASSIPTLERLRMSAVSDVSKRAGQLLGEIARESVPPLRITTLGTFEVERGGEVLGTSDWKSGKALAVLKYLASMPEGAKVSRDVLMELLWPGSAPEPAAKNLGMALSSLRKTLEPDSPRGESSYLLTDGDSVQLELGLGGRIDYRSFRELVKEAGAAEATGDRDGYLDRLEQAEAMYGGEFLPGDLYQDWCAPERERLRREYVEVLARMMTEHQRRGDCARALAYCEKAIETDPEWEELYRSLMDIHSRLGDSAGVERAFARCREFLAQNFEVSPSPQTVDLYHCLRQR